jgi:hypothetical protein
MACVAIAVDQYYVKQSKFPATLDELGIPLPRDPFAGKSIRYNCERGGLVLSYEASKIPRWFVSIMARQGFGAPPDIVRQSRNHRGR